MRHEAHSPALRQGSRITPSADRFALPVLGTFITKKFPFRQLPEGESEGNVNLIRRRSAMARWANVALKEPLNLGTKQPAVVGLGTGVWCSRYSAGVGTFPDGRGSAAERVGPDRVGRENTQFRSREISPLWLDRGRDSEHSHRSAPAVSGCSLETADVVLITSEGLTLDGDVVGDPIVRSDAGFV